MYKLTEFERASVVSVICLGRSSCHLVAYLFSCSFIPLELFLDGQSESIFVIKLRQIALKRIRACDALYCCSAVEADGAWSGNKNFVWFKTLKRIQLNFTNFTESERSLLNIS